MWQLSALFSQHVHVLAHNANKICAKWVGSHEDQLHVIGLHAVHARGVGQTQVLQLLQQLIGLVRAKIGTGGIDTVAVVGQLRRFGVHVEGGNGHTE